MMAMKAYFRRKKTFMIRELIVGTSSVVEELAKVHRGPEFRYSSLTKLCMEQVYDKSLDADFKVIDNKYADRKARYICDIYFLQTPTDFSKFYFTLKAVDKTYFKPHR